MTTITMWYYALPESDVNPPKRRKAVRESFRPSAFSRPFIDVWIQRRSVQRTKLLVRLLHGGDVAILWCMDPPKRMDAYYSSVIPCWQRGPAVEVCLCRRVVSHGWEFPSAPRADGECAQAVALRAGDSQGFVGSLVGGAVGEYSYCGKSKTDYVTVFLILVTGGH